MSFVNIDSTKPAGNEKIATADNYIRELKGDIETNLSEISGYPNNVALKQAIWTTLTRPSTNLVTGLSGFNTTLGVSEHWNGTEWVNDSFVSTDIEDIAATVTESYFDTDGTLNANSDEKIATQKAVKTYVENQAYSPPSGTILQVVNAIKTDAYSANNLTTWTTATGLTCSITPSSTSSKIIILVSLAARASNLQMVGGLFRDSTQIAVSTAGSVNGSFVVGDSMGDDTNTYTVFHIDSPSTTSNTTYSIKFINGSGGSGTIYINKTWGAAGENGAISSIILAEIKG